MSKIMHARFNTDNGAMVLVPTRRTPRIVDGNAIKATTAMRNMHRKVRYANSKRDQKLAARLALSSGVRSPTQEICDAVELVGFLPFSMGGTNGIPRIDNVLR